MTDASITDASLTGPARGAASPHDPELRDFFALLKPKVMSLVVFCALVGLVAAPVAVNPFIAFVAILCIAVGGGASGALNMWWDADIDAVMKRTRNRPIPSGRVTPEAALALGLALSGFAVILLGLAAGPVPAALLAFTIFFYVVVYTMWLKRSTPQNIVIGGLSGALPPLIGWSVATGGIAIEPVLMVLLVFMWTPPHFWALALFVRSDYGDAGVPMLTEVRGRRATRNQIAIYAVLLVPVALGLAVSSVGGPIFLAVAAYVNWQFLSACLAVWRRNEAQAEADGYAAEKRAFKVSLSYTFLQFAALLAEALLQPFGYGGWDWVLRLAGAA
ncbi:heme o synthase [Pseudoroseicyclus aestuarii]|uniref:Protoheme IX farnesyltransferase n=1 Tax=Pseudoroseicyclus aestuarii TaxID=1795041 RepID=A0A318SUF5_9RHOB|nr:heme o synthase [Pseudoroseicyclus aestuarii]PYE84995.1 protoheme IX farnesyltransferase [Pseudoroseicyclus aestuarii]